MLALICGVMLLQLSLSISLTPLLSDSFQYSDISPKVIDYEEEIMKVLEDQCLSEGMGSDCVEFIDFFGERPESNNKTIFIHWPTYDIEETNRVVIKKDIILFDKYECNNNNETLDYEYFYNFTYLVNSTFQLSIGAKLRDLFKFNKDYYFWDVGTNEF